MAVIYHISVCEVPLAPQTRGPLFIPLKLPLGNSPSAEPPCPYYSVSFPSPLFICRAVASSGRAVVVLLLGQLAAQERFCIQLRLLVQDSPLGYG